MVYKILVVIYLLIISNLSLDEIKKKWDGNIIKIEIFYFIYFVSII